MKCYLEADSMRKKDIVSQLLSGHGSAYRKYRGHHVLIAGRKVIPLRRGKTGLKDFQRLSRDFGKPPLVLFVPREDVTYILTLCL